MAASDLVRFACVAALVSGCSNEASSHKPAAPKPKPDLVKFSGDGDPRSIVLAARDKAEAEGRILMIYVGAPWCEPCTRFHDALVAGKLDDELAGLRFLEIDHDANLEMLRALRCNSKMIPLFSVPDAVGFCSGVRVEGGIKGEGAVPDLVPQIRALVPSR